MSELLVGKLVQSDAFTHILAIVIGGIIGNLIMENFIYMKNDEHKNNQSTIGRRSLTFEEHQKKYEENRKKIMKNRKRKEKIRKEKIRKENDLKDKIIKDERLEDDCLLDDDYLYWCKHYQLD